MSETNSQTPSSVAETMLATLYIRAMESQRSDAIVKDEKAVALVREMRYDLDRIRQLPLSKVNKVTLVLRTREIDRYARDFLARRPAAVVIHIGCGLDSRFERVDNGQVEWYDLGLPDVIALRRKFIGDEGERYHLLGGSVLDNTWLGTVSAHRARPFLFLAEGVFMYFEKAQVKSLVLTLRDHFPGAELVFDAFSPLHIWINRLQMSIANLEFGALFHWGLWRGQEIEGWGAGIRLLDDWGYLDRPEPRLAHVRWMRHIPLAARAGRIYHFRLGKAEG